MIDWSPDELFPLVESTNTSANDLELVKEASRAVVSAADSFYAYTPNQKVDSAIVNFLPNYDLRSVISMVRNDAVAWGAITTLLDRTFLGGWRIDDVNDVRDEQTEDKLKNKGIDFWMREMALHYYIFRNTFGEIVFNPSGVGIDELHTLDTTLIIPLATTHGEVVGYEQRFTAIGTPTTIVHWDKDEVIHIHDPSLNMNCWGEISIKTVYQAVSIKYHIKKFIQWLFETNQFRGIYNPKSAERDTVIRFITFLKESEKNIAKPVIVEGEFDYKLMRNIEGFDQLVKMLDKCDQEILTLLQVPPILVGVPDNSNRSNSDAQMSSLDTHIHSVQRLFEDAINEVLRRAKIYGRTFKFNHLLTITDAKKVLDAVKIMSDVGMSKDVIAQFMRDQGFSLPTHGVFDTAAVTTAPQDPNANKDGKTYPSRTTKGTGEGNQKIGTGDNASTRPDQLVGNSDAFRHYPYTFEVTQ